MYESLLALHTVDPKTEDVVIVENVYIAHEYAGIQSANRPVKRSRAPTGLFQGVYLASICYHIIRRWLEPQVWAIIR